jgi:hypothetical protein
MNMFRAVKAKTTKGYFESLPSDRREILEFLDKLIKETAPSLRPHFANNMPGYGSFKYKNYKGEVVDWPTIAIASQKNYVSFYVCAMEDGKYIAEKYKQSLASHAGKKGLGKVSVGRSCIRFKKIEDLNIAGLKKIIKQAQSSPGLGEYEKSHKKSA